MIEYKTKEEYRKWAKEVRKSLDLKDISVQIENKIKNLHAYKSSKNVMSYLAKDIEISLAGLFENKTKNWYLPTVIDGGKKPQLYTIPYIPDKTKLQKGQFNILEPELINDVYFDQIEKFINLDLIFVPGLCFDKNGSRLGFGKGYYDQFLRLNQKSFKIGCCPKKCLIDILPTDDWDIKIDLVITE